MRCSSACYLVLLFLSQAMVSGRPSRTESFPPSQSISSSATTTLQSSKSASPSRASPTASTSPSTSMSPSRASPTASASPSTSPSRLSPTQPDSSSWSNSRSGPGATASDSTSPTLSPSSTGTLSRTFASPSISTSVSLSQLTASAGHSQSATASNSTSRSQSDSSALSSSVGTRTTSRTRRSQTLSASRSCPFVFSSIYPEYIQLYSDWYAPYVASRGTDTVAKITISFSAAASAAVLRAKGVAAGSLQVLSDLSDFRFENMSFPFQTIATASGAASGQTSRKSLGNSSSDGWVPQLTIEGSVIIPLALDIYAKDIRVSFAFAGTSFNCARASLAEPVTISFVGTELPLPRSVRSAAAAVALATAPLVAISSGSLIMLQMRHVLQLELSVCDRSFSLPVPLLWNPLQLHFGPAEGQYLRGSLVGSVVLVCSMVLLSLLLLLCVRFMPHVRCCWRARTTNSSKRKNNASLLVAAESLRLPGALFNLCYFPFILPGVYLACSLVTRVAVSAELVSVSLDTSWPLAYLVVLLGVPTLLPLAWIVSIGFAFHIRSNDMRRTISERLATLDAWFMGSSFWKENYPQYQSRLKLWYPIFAAFRDKRQWFILIEAALCAGYGISGALLWRDCLSARLLFALLAIFHAVVWIILQPHDAYGHVFCNLCALAASVICSFLLAVASISMERSGGPLATLSDTISVAEIVLTSVCGIVTIGKALRSSAAVTRIESVVWNSLARLRNRGGAAGLEGEGQRGRRRGQKTEDDVIWEWCQQYECTVMLAEEGDKNMQLSFTTWKGASSLSSEPDAGGKEDAEESLGVHDTPLVPCAVDIRGDRDLSSSRDRPREAVGSESEGERHSITCSTSYVVAAANAAREASEVEEEEEGEKEEEEEEEEEEDDEEEEDEEEEDEAYFMRISSQQQQQTSVAGEAAPDGSSWVFIGSSSDSDFTETVDPASSRQKQKQLPRRHLRQRMPHQQLHALQQNLDDPADAPQQSGWAPMTEAAPRDSLLLALPIPSNREERRAQSGVQQLRLRGEILRLLERSRTKAQPCATSSSSTSTSSTSSKSSRSSTTKSSPPSSPSPLRWKPLKRIVGVAAPCANAIDVAVAEQLADGNYAATEDLLE